MKSFKIECAGYAVDADWYEGGADEILLCLIGWTSTRAKYVPIVQAIVEKTGMSALVFEYSGHGESPMDVMQTRPAQHFLEVICVFDWLKQQHPNAKITVMGTSYGGYMATVLMAYRAFDRLILRIPAIYRPIDFYSLNGEVNSDEAWDATANYRSDKADIADHPFLKNVSKFLGPRLVVVHEKDEQVPVETTDAFIEALHAEVYLAKDFPHSTRAMPPDKIVQYQNAICDWLNTTR